MKAIIKKLVDEVIELAYNKRKYLVYAKKKLDIVDDILQLGKKYNIQVSYYPHFYAEQEVFVHFDEFKQGNFEIKYSLQIFISKVCKAYNYTFYNAIELPDPNGIDYITTQGTDIPCGLTTIDVWTEKPITKSQDLFIKKLSILFMKSGYTHINEYKRYKNICRNDFIKDFPKATKQEPTISLVLFSDYFGLIEEEEERIKDKTETE
jgi:hypothetical protein